MTSKIQQFDLFVNAKAQLEEQEKEEFKKMVSKSIRGLYARYNEMEFTILELHKRLDRLTEISIKEIQ